MCGFIFQTFNFIFVFMFPFNVFYQQMSVTDVSVETYSFVLLIYNNNNNKPGDF